LGAVLPKWAAESAPAGRCPATLGVPLAPWRSGYAAACKAVYTGSIPVGASRLASERPLWDG
jgi:hypothetical protein